MPLPSNPLAPKEKALFRRVRPVKPLTYDMIFGHPGPQDPTQYYSYLDPFK